MKFSPKFVLSVATLAFPAALSAASFEGKVTMKMTHAQSANAQELVYHVKEGFIRTDVEGARGQMGSVIMDLTKREMTILIPGQNMYMVRPMPDASTVEASAAKHEGEYTFDKTGETETILGYHCVKYVSKSKKTSSDIWVTEELGQFMGLGSGGPMGGPRRKEASPAWVKTLMGKNFFPMRVVTHDANGTEESRLETTAVEKGAQPAELFAPPADYRKFDLGGMMQGLMKGAAPSDQDH